MQTKNHDLIMSYPPNVYDIVTFLIMFFFITHDVNSYYICCTMISEFFCIVSKLLPIHQLL